MKIAEMRVTPIAITDPPLRNAAGLHAPYALRTIVELVTTDNIYGLGEVPGNIDITATLESAREIVIGRDPFQLNGLQMALHEHFSENDTEGPSQTPWVQRILGYVNSALEVACLDIIGKATNRPVVDLLGGAVRRCETGCRFPPIFSSSTREQADLWPLIPIQTRPAGQPPVRPKRSLPKQ